MNDISIPDVIDFRRAIQEWGFATAATTISSISGGNDSQATFEVIINGISVTGVIGYVHPLPFTFDYVGAKVLVGVYHRKDYVSKVSKLPEELLPEDYELDMPITFAVTIVDTCCGISNTHGYDYEVADPTLRTFR